MSDDQDGITAAGGLSALASTYDLPVCGRLRDALPSIGPVQRGTVFYDPDAAPLDPPPRSLLAIRLLRRGCLALRHLLRRTKFGRRLTCTCARCEARHEACRCPWCAP